MASFLRPVLTGCFAVSLLVGSAAGAAAAGESCLRMQDIATTKMIDSKTMSVRLRDGEMFRVTFANICNADQPRMSGSFFVYDRWATGDCLHKNVAFSTSRLGPCFVDSVTQISASGS